MMNADLSPLFDAAQSWNRTAFRLWEMHLDGLMSDFRRVMK